MNIIYRERAARLLIKLNMVKKHIFVFLVCFALFFTVCSSGKRKWTFQLSIIHMNDIHARFEEIDPSGGICKSNDCVGGFSRLYSAVNRLVSERPNPIVLNAGDNFQGTFWYNIYKWNVTQNFLNFLPIDAYTLGNHEFDDRIKGLVPFLKTLKAPVVVTNIDDGEEPNIQGLYNKSVIIQREGKKIGIIGVVTRRTMEMSATGKLKLLNEIESVNKEAERLVAEDNVDTIIVLSHCGYDQEQIMAENAAPKIGVIVGGHSHTLLYSDSPLPGPDKSSGPYPTVVNHRDGRKILVVQASAFTKYLGNITVRYDENGDVVSWSGDPLYLNGSIPQDDRTNQEIQRWREGLENIAEQVVGHTNVLLRQDNCRYSECTLGNFVTDTMIYSQLETDNENAWTNAAIAVINSGALRTSIQKGNMTYSDLATMLPFKNTLDVGELQGKYLKDFLEYAGGRHNNTSSFDINLMPVSGLKVVYNITKPIGSRVQSLKIRCRECLEPLYEELDASKYYRIIVNSFLCDGGDGHTALKNHMINRKTGQIDIDALVRYAQERSPIIQELQDRIKVVK